MQLDAELARTEPDPEIQELIKASVGLNLALDYLPGSVTFDPAVEKVDGELASCIVWFDAFVTNVDRTARNTNMLMWHRKLWLIDHGASLYFHHSRDGFLERATQPFALIKDHVLLPFADRIAEVDATLASRLTRTGAGEHRRAHSRCVAGQHAEIRLRRISRAPAASAARVCRGGDPCANR